ncbi:MAG: hypothetical protein HDR16_05515 [Lachnospiraceae bacterium]|nr:hypothetical protein [Lachnospiraceae bacterium]
MEIKDENGQVRKRDDMDNDIAMGRWCPFSFMLLVYDKSVVSPFLWLGFFFFPISGCRYDERISALQGFL